MASFCISTTEEMAFFYYYSFLWRLWLNRSDRCTAHSRQLSSGISFIVTGLMVTALGSLKILLLLLLLLLKDEHFAKRASSGQLPQRRRFASPKVSKCSKKSSKCIQNVSFARNGEVAKIYSCFQFRSKSDAILNFAALTAFAKHIQNFVKSAYHSRSRQDSKNGV